MQQLVVFSLGSEEYGLPITAGPGDHPLHASPAPSRRRPPRSAASSTCAARSSRSATSSSASALRRRGGRGGQDRHRRGRRRHRRADRRRGRRGADRRRGAARGAARPQNDGYISRRGQGRRPPAGPARPAPAVRARASARVDRRLAGDATERLAARMTRHLDRPRDARARRRLRRLAVHAPLPHRRARRRRRRRVVGTRRDGRARRSSRAARARPDVMTLDMQMPGLTGIDVLRQLPPGGPRRDRRLGAHRRGLGARPRRALDRRGRGHPQARRSATLADRLRRDLGATVQAPPPRAARDRRAARAAVAPAPRRPARARGAAAGRAPARATALEPARASSRPRPAARARWPRSSRACRSPCGAGVRDRPAHAARLHRDARAPGSTPPRALHVREAKDGDRDRAADGPARARRLPPARRGRAASA